MKTGKELNAMISKRRKKVKQLQMESKYERDNGNPDVSSILNKEIGWINNEINLITEILN
jgi:hypothetical protein